MGTSNLSFFFFFHRTAINKTSKPDMGVIGGQGFGIEDGGWLCNISFWVYLIQWQSHNIGVWGWVPNIL